MVNAEGSPARTRKVVAVLFAVYAFLVFIATIITVISLASANDLLANATHVNGQVVGLNYDTRGRRAPVVRFETTNGEMLQLKSDFYTSPGPNVGDTIRVVYRTSNPRDWRIDDWIHLYFWALMGLIFMFTWSMAITITTLAGRHQIRKLEQAGASSGQPQRNQTSQNY